MLAWTLAVGLAVLVGVRALGAEHGTLLALLVGALPADAAARVRRCWCSRSLWRRRLLTAVCAGSRRRPPARGRAGARRRRRCRPEPPPLRTCASSCRTSTSSTPTRRRPVGRCARSSPTSWWCPSSTRRGLRGLAESGLLEDLPHVSPSSARARRPSGCSAGCRWPTASTRSAGGRELPRATVDVDGTRGAAARRAPAAAAVGARGAAGAARWPTSRPRRGRTDLPVVVLGDFNADRDHAPFRAAARHRSARRARRARPRPGPHLADEAAAAAPGPRAGARRRRRPPGGRGRAGGACCPAATTAPSSPTSRCCRSAEPASAPARRPARGAAKRPARSSTSSGRPNARDSSGAGRAPRAPDRPPGCGRATSSSAWVVPIGTSSTWWVTSTLGGPVSSAASRVSSRSSASRAPRSSPAAGSSSSMQLGVGHQRPRQQHPLALALRQRAEPPVGEGPQADPAAAGRTPARTSPSS